MTPRQEKLLKAIIEEFIETANAVGSLSIPEKYEIDASPATIRNEMARLVDQGYLEKPHASSGRVPTTSGFKYYLKRLLDDLEELDAMEEIEMNERFHQIRHNKVELITNAVQKLKNISNNTAVILFDDHVYVSGLSKLIGYESFTDQERLEKLMDVIENYKDMYEMFSAYQGNDIKVLIGEDIGVEGLMDVAVVYTPIKLYRNDPGYVGIIGPNRMNYTRIIPSVRLVANSLESVVRGW